MATKNPEMDILSILDFTSKCLLAACRAFGRVLSKEETILKGTTMSADLAAFPDRETVADKLAVLGESEQAYLCLLMENPQQDENLLEGLDVHLNRAAGARFLNSLKLERLGEWLGGSAPARLQMRLTETARSSQHAAYAAFRTGLIRSGGLEKAYPKA
jgi:hypothetical protein